MGKPITKDGVILHKKQSIQKLNKIFEMLINSPNPKHQKKADLIAYWLEDYCNYIEREERFDYKTVLRFARGSIIRVNFGFNVGSEHGGLHFAVVLDNDNKHNSPVLTVIPLSSSDGSGVYERDVFLGNELYEKLISKNKNELSDIQEKIQEKERFISAVQLLIKMVEDSTNVIKLR